MSRRLPLPLLVCLLLTPAAQAVAQGPSAPRISFEENSVVARSLTPGAPVVWFGVEHRVDEEYSTELVRRYELGTAAADGTARLDLKAPVVRRSCWVVVDGRSGAYEVAAPEGYRVARPQRPPRLGPGHAAEPDGIADERTYLVGLVVRPGVGAWTFFGGEGGDRDVDPAAGQLRFSLDQLDPLPGSPAAPQKAESGDLWFTVDPLRMEISVNKGGVAR